jgi:hypothetical protein
MIIDILTQGKGSDVTNVINGDHKAAAEAYLVEKGFADAWEVRVADDKTLMLDYDDRPYETHEGSLPEQFYDILGILEQAMRQAVYFTIHESKGGNTHGLVHLPITMDVYERIAWQAAFGSDPKREALHLLSVSRNETNPILLFMRKDEQRTGVDVNGEPIVKASSYEIATPQKLLAAGVTPLQLLGEVDNG